MKRNSDKRTKMGQLPGDISPRGKAKLMEMDKYSPDFDDKEPHAGAFQRWIKLFGKKKARRRSKDIPTDEG